MSGHLSLLSKMHLWLLLRLPFCFLNIELYSSPPTEGGGNENVSFKSLSTQSKVRESTEHLRCWLPYKWKIMKTGKRNIKWSEFLRDSYLGSYTSLSCCRRGMGRLGWRIGDSQKKRENFSGAWVRWKIAPPANQARLDSPHITAAMGFALRTKWQSKSCGRASPPMQPRCQGGSLCTELAVRKMAFTPRPLLQPGILSLETTHCLLADTPPFVIRGRLPWHCPCLLSLSRAGVWDQDQCKKHQNPPAGCSSGG